MREPAKNEISNKAKQQNKNSAVISSLQYNVRKLTLRG